jgi:DNA-binding IclR family transcriptional regulator
MGRVLLSELADRDVRELYRDERSGAAGLLKQLAEDRITGTVVQNSIYEPGVASVAAPVRDVTGKVVAAINISVVALFTSEAELNGPLKAEVAAAAEAISRDLGRKDIEKYSEPADIHQPQPRRTGR